MTDSSANPLFDHRLLLAIALSALTMTSAMTACLSKPAPPGTGPEDGGTGIDASATCAKSLALPTAFAPDSTVFGTGSKVADLNGDCLDDLVIPGRIDSARTGIFLIFGRQAGFLQGYDAALEVQDMPDLVWEPLEIELADATGDGIADLLIVGVEPATSDAVLVVFVGDSDPSNPHPFTAPPLVRRTSNSYLIANSTTEVHEPAYVMAARQDPAADNGVVFGASSWAVSLSLPSGPWSQLALDAATLTPVEGLDTAGIEGMSPARRTAPDADGLLAVSQTRFTFYGATTPAPGSFVVGGIGIEFTPGVSSPAVVARGTDGFGDDFAIWSIGGTELRFSGAHWLSPTAAGLIARRAAMPGDYAANAGLEFLATEIAGSPSWQDLLILYKVGDSASRLRILADVAVGSSTVTNAGNGAFDLGDAYQRLVTGNFTSTESPAAKQIWVLPATLTAQAAPLCLSVMPTETVGDYCFAPCGTSEC